jgi:hypothetical protein
VGAARYQWFTPWEPGDGLELSQPPLVCRRETNITLNALDRHADGANRTKLALIWIGEDGSERKVTYYELRRWSRNLPPGCARWACRRATASSSTCR